MTLAPLAATSTITVSTDVTTSTTFEEGEVLYQDNTEFVCIDDENGCTKDTIGNDDTKWIEADAPILDANITTEQAESLANGDETRCSQWRKGTSWQVGQLACFKKASWKCLNADYCASLKPGGRDSRDGPVWQDMSGSVPVDRKALREIADTKDAMKFAENVKYRAGQTIVAKGIFFECEDATGCKGLDPISTEAENTWKIVEDIQVDPPASEDLGEIKEWAFDGETMIEQGELVKTEDGTAMLECLDPVLCKSIPPDASETDLEGVWREVQQMFIDLKLPQEELVILLFDLFTTYVKDEVVKDDTTGLVFECVDDEKCNEPPAEDSEGWEVKPDIEAPEDQDVTILGKFYYWNIDIPQEDNDQWHSIMPGDLVVGKSDADMKVYQTIELANADTPEAADALIATIRQTRDIGSFFWRQDLIVGENVIKRPSPVFTKKAVQVYEPGVSVLTRGSEWMQDDQTNIVKRVVKDCDTNDCDWMSDVFKTTRLYGIIEDPSNPLPTSDYYDWVKGAHYLAGDIVMVDNKLFECCQSCATTPDLSLEMSCQWVAPRNINSAWDSIPNPPGNSLGTIESVPQECTDYKDTIWGSNVVFTDDQGEEVRVSQAQFEVNDFGCFKGRVFECKQANGGTLDDCNTIDPNQDSTATFNSGEVQAQNWELKRMTPERKEIEKPQEISAFDFSEAQILIDAGEQIIFKTGDVVALQVKGSVTLLDPEDVTQTLDVDTFIEEQIIFKCLDTKRCAMINPLDHDVQEEIDLAWEELEGLYAITEWKQKLPAVPVECIDWDLAMDPWAEVAVNFKKGDLACVGSTISDNLSVFRCNLECNDFRPLMWDGTFNSKYWSFEPVKGVAVEPEVKPKVECSPYDSNYPYISGDLACVFGVPFTCEQDMREGSCTEMGPDLLGEDLENVWVLLEGFRTDYDIEEVEPEPFEIITNCPHWEQIAYDQDSHKIVTDTTKDFTTSTDVTEKERADITDVIVCEDKVAFICLDSKSCYSASPSQWKFQLTQEGKDTSFSPWLEIRAYGDNTDDTETEINDWKPSFEDSTGNFFDCVKDSFPDQSIPPYEEMGYNIIDGQVCLDPNSPAYPDLKRFFESHQTINTQEIDEGYDEYVYSDYDETMLPKNVRVLSYALTQTEFEIIMAEAIMESGNDVWWGNLEQAYFDFMFAAAHIPAFCGEKSPEDPRDMIEVCRNELTLFFFDVTANSRFDEVSGNWVGITETEDITCAESVADTTNYNGECDNFMSFLALDEMFLDTEGTALYRRGFGAGLEGVEDYAALSAIVFGDRTVLLREPWLVSEDLSLAFGAAMYKWMQRNSRANDGIRYPSGHEIATGIWAGNE